MCIRDRFFTLSVGCKLQAGFLLLVMAVLWLKGKYKLWHFLLVPVFYVLLVLPAVALGKPFLETLTLYASQTGSIGDGLAIFYNFFVMKSND